MRPRRVLIIEDNADAAESMRALLRTDGHHIELAYDGAAGLAKLEEFRAEFVLLDIGLPRMDGFMVAHAIRERFALAAGVRNCWRLRAMGVTMIEPLRSRRVSTDTSPSRLIRGACYRWSPTRRRYSPTSRESG